MFWLKSVLAFTLAAVLAACSTTNPPDQQRPIEFQGTRTEYVQLQADCLREAGWSVNVVDDPIDGPVMAIGGITDENTQQFDADSVACEESLPPKPEADTDDEFRELFDNQVARYECMVEAGFAPDPPPSFAVFLEAIRSGKVNWTPEDGLAETDLLRAKTECPGDVDAWW